MTTIELGELGTTDVMVAREMSGGTRRSLLAALVAGACLLALGASAVGRPVLGEPLWTGVVSLVGFSLGSDSLYLAEPDGRVTLARQLRTGLVRWRLDIDSLPLSSTDVGDGLAAVQTRVPAPAGQGTNTVMLVREATGEVLGTAQGDVLGTARGGHRLFILDAHELANQTCPEWGEPCVDISTVDTRTGQVERLLSLTGAEHLGVSIMDGVLDSYATFRDDGTIELYDAASGELVDTTTVSGGLSDSVKLTPTFLFTSTFDGATLRVDAYRRAPLTRIWSTTLPASGPPEHPVWWLADDCGAAVCLSAGDRSVVIDPDTGLKRFEYPGELAAVGGSGVLLGARSKPPGPDPTRDIDLLDPVTGAVLSTIPDVIGVEWRDSAGRVLLAQQGPHRTAFVVVEPSGRTQALGSVAGTGLNCQARTDVLACAEPSGLLRVWSLPGPVMLP